MGAKITLPLLYPRDWTDYEHARHQEFLRSCEVTHARQRSEAWGLVLLKRLTGTAERPADEFHEMITMLCLESDLVKI